MPEGTFEEIEIAVLDVTQTDLPVGLEELSKEGIHFELDRALLAADEDHEDFALQWAAAERARWEGP